MRFRSAPLRAAAALAVLFVAVRIVYRVLFHGADGAGPTLLDLPLWRLPAPFAHVEILGPVTTGGLADAVASALPIALTILAFGLLSAFLDMPRLIARAARRGPFQGIARAVSIAWAALPSLATSVRATRRAQRLRGERGGIRLLAPVLESTLERASAIAATLELRGYAGREREGDCTAPVALRDLSLGFAGGGPVVRTRELTLAAGTLTVLTGPTGSGKTTLLRALSGLHSHTDGGWIHGVAQVVGHDRQAVPPRELARRIGVVLQQPRHAFATTRVADEIGLALEMRGVAPVIAAARVRTVAERIGIAGLLDRPCEELSAGESTLVAIAAAIVDDPILLLVDEPLADLDAAARRRIIAVLAALAHEAGIAVLVAEHRAAEFRADADRWLTVDDGEIVASDGPDEPAVALVPASAGARRPAPGGPLALSASKVSVRHGARLAVDEASLSLTAGEIVALRGPNGAGKSSLLGALATDSAARVGAVALVPDDADALFSFDTVAAECRRVDRRRGLASGTTAALFAELLDLGDTPLTALLRRHPRDLSTGQRRCLALALQAAARPRTLLLDEPTRGLDPAARHTVAAAIALLAHRGTAVLIATHDDDVGALADRELSMDAGVLRPATRASAPVLAAAPRPSPASSRVSTPARSRTVPSLAAPRSPSAVPRWRTPALIAANLVAVAAFAWPLVAIATPGDAQAAVPVIALSLAPLAVVVFLAALDTSVRSAHTLALLAVLAAVGAAIRIASTGVGGVEALFVLLILAGRAFGPRFGMLLGAAAIALSALMWGGVGPWLPFQMFACGWVGAGAGLLPRRVRGIPEVVLLAGYGIAASYLFGLVMNMWFWPFAVGSGTSISYVPGGTLSENLSHFLVYSLLTSTLSWDTLRALTTVILLTVLGRALLRSLRRAKPVAVAPVGQ